MPTTHTATAHTATAHTTSSRRRAVTAAVTMLVTLLCAGPPAARAAKPRPTRDPLILAIRAGETANVRKLLKGRDLEAGWANMTLLHLAAMGGHHAIVKLLLDRGAKIEAVMQGRDTKTALLLATQGGHDRTVRLLLKRGAKLRAPAQEGGLAHAAAIGGLVWLLKRCKTEGISLTGRGRHGETPFDLAARFERPAAIRYLASQGAPFDAPNKQGYTPLHNAAQLGNLKVVRALLKLKANVNTSLPRSGWTALQSAIFYKKRKVARLLIRQRGIKLNMMIAGHGDYHGWRALTLACFKELPAVALDLIRAGADVNAAVTKPGPQSPPRWRSKRWSDGYWGWTPLHFAAAQGQVTILTALLKKGASKRSKNLAGKTPRDVATGATRRHLR
jgi:ankyrin repeat protein